MTLAEMAKQMQQETISPEVQELRRMRKFIAVHDYNEMNGRWAEVARMLAKGEELTFEEQYRILKMQEELNRDYKLLNIYRKAIALAEHAERKERGGGAAFYQKYQEGIHKAEKGIYQKAKKYENMQVALGELC